MFNIDKKIFDEQRFNIIEEVLLQDGKEQCYSVELATLNEVDEYISLVAYLWGELRVIKEKETRLNKHTLRF